MPLSAAVEPSPDIEAVLNCFPEPAILLGLDYRIVLANRAYRELYGTPDGARRHCYEVSHRYSVPCDLAGESCPLKQSLATRENSRVLHVHHTPRGQEFVNVEMWPVRDPQTDEVRYFIERMRPSDAASVEASTERLVGRSPAFRRMLALVERAAPSTTTVMLLGETGTGKELVAQTIHRLSERNGKAFVPVECTGLPETLFESELFGYEKGAFTGATSSRGGLVEAAAGGTLFLDEVGEIPLADQVKLLRLLETKRYRPVGGTEWREADFRLVCATNRNLAAMVAGGAFREDLYYRLDVFEIELPPLRERRDDLEPLIATILERIGAKHVSLAPDALALLRAYRFPGNVRELRNVLERAVLLADDNVIRPRDLPRHCREGNGAAVATAVHDAAPDEIVTLAEAEQRYLGRALALHRGDRRSLAARLGISERALYRKLAGIKDGDGP